MKLIITLDVNDSRPDTVEAFQRNVGEGRPMCVVSGGVALWATAVELAVERTRREEAEQQ